MLARAGRFLEAEGRPLERALFSFRFVDGDAAGVVRALERFANADGGFGHALEPDVRAPDSSALATGIALQALAEVGCPVDHPLARGAVAWLRANFDAEAGVWRVVPPGANGHAHAPWWRDEDGSLARTFDGFAIIPRARLAAALRRAIPRAVERDPAKWSTYCVTPLRAVPAPDSIGADLIAAELQAHLDAVAARQADDRGWHPSWESTAAWTHEWRSILTLEAATRLHAFGRC